MNVRFSRDEIRIRLEVQELRNLASHGFYTSKFTLAGVGCMEWSISLVEGEAKVGRKEANFSFEVPRKKALELVDKLDTAAKKKDMQINFQLNGFSFVLDVDYFDAGQLIKENVRGQGFDGSKSRA